MKKTRRFRLSIRTTHDELCMDRGCSICDQVRNEPPEATNYRLRDYKTNEVLFEFCPKDFERHFGKKFRNGVVTITIAQKK